MEFYVAWFRIRTVKVLSKGLERLTQLVFGGRYFFIKRCHNREL